MFKHPDPTIRAAAQRAFDALLDAIPVSSISAQGLNLDEGAQHFSGVLEKAGLRAEIWDGEGAPTVFAERPAADGRPTLLFYGHYDVQPPDPLDDWDSPPFEPTLRDGAIFGRGAGDNKGQLLAHVGAIAELIARDELDIGVKFLVEGEEEIGSPHVAAVAEAHADRLHADLALTADAPVHDDGSPVVIFGVRGLLFIEVELAGAPADLHSGNRGGIAPTPAWELVHALASLRAADGRVLVPGFYDVVRDPEPAEIQMLDRLPVNQQQLTDDLGEAGAARWQDESPWRALGFKPNCNIAGITSGYQGTGAKTVIPSRASAKIDFRLVADQDPDAVFEAVANHLRDINPNVGVRKLAAVPPSATSPENPRVQSVIEAVRHATGRDPLLRPRLGGTTPDYVFTQVLGIPSVLVPYGPTNMNHHAPNERMTIEAIERGAACTVEICRALGQEEA